MEKDERLSGPYSIDMFKDTPIKVEAYKMKAGSHPNGFVVHPKGARLEFMYWPDAKIFEETFLRPEDLLINELAYFFFITADERLESAPLSLVERSIKKRYFPDLQPEIGRIHDEITNLTRDLKDHFRNAIKNIADFNINVLSENSIKAIRKRMSQGELLSESEMQDALQRENLLTLQIYRYLSNYSKAIRHYCSMGNFLLGKSHPRKQRMNWKMSLLKTQKIFSGT